MGSDWDEDWRRKRLEQIIDLEQIDGLVEPRVPPDARYKKQKGEKGKGKPTMRVGLPVVVKVEGWFPRRGLRGYLGCIVLDWTEPEPARWWSRSTIIVQVVAASQPDLEGRVGRLRAVQAERSWGGSQIVAYGKSRWDRYKLEWPSGG